MTTESASDVLQNLGSKLTNQKKASFLRGPQLFATLSSFIKFCCKTIVCILKRHWSVKQKGRYPLFSINVVFG